MNQTIDLSKHPFSVKANSEGYHYTIGHFSNLDVAVRTARDFSFYHGCREFPSMERIETHIFDNTTGSIFSQEYVDYRSEQLFDQDSRFV